MIYRSNLVAPDLSKYFKLKNPPLQICGHDMPSDPDFEPECGFWTIDEAAILFNIAREIGGRWIDVGARFGWTGAYLLEAGVYVAMVDPHYVEPDRRQRLFLNLGQRHHPTIWSEIDLPFQDVQFYGPFDGVVVDGCHSEPAPFQDAAKAAFLNAKVILFHDTWGKPVHDGINYLIDSGYKCRMYDTPNGVACLWNNPSWDPPFHIADPNVPWARLRQQCGFDYSRCV